VKKLIFILLLIPSIAFAADYDGDKKSNEIAAHGGSVATTTRIFIQDPVDTDIVTYATAQEIATAVLGTSYDTTAELTALFGGKQDASAVLDTYAGIDPAANVQSILDAADYAAIRGLLDLEAGTDFYSIAAADLAFEAIDSNDIDPDRLAGDTDDDNLIDATLIDINGATTETSIAADDKVLIYDTSGTAVKAMTRGNFVTGIGAGQAVTLDLGDLGTNQSTDLGEIATTGDTNSIFTEDSADKLLIDLGNNWPQADTAVAASAQAITDNAIATVDDLDAADNDFAKFTAAGLEGRSYAEVRQDLGIDTAANLETSLSLGAYASDILGAADSDALVTLLGLVAGDIPDLSATYEGQLANSAGLAAALSDETGTGVAVFGTNPTLTGATMGGDFNINAHEIQSTGNIVLQLGNNDGTSYLQIQDSDGSDSYRIYDDGSVAAVETVNPYWLFADSNLATEFAIQSFDTTVDQLRFGVSTDSMAAPTFTAYGYMDANHLHYDGNMNLTTGHTYQINDTQINIGNLGAGGNWTPTGSINLDSATLTLNSDNLTVDDGSNYSEFGDADDDTIDELMAAINATLVASAAGTLTALTDTEDVDYTDTAIMIADGDSFNEKVLSGDIGITNAGIVTIANNAVTMAKLDDDGNFTDWTGNWTFGTGTFTLNNGLVIADAGNIGSASDTDAIAISAGGEVTFSQEVQAGAGIDVSGGTLVLAADEIDSADINGGAIDEEHLNASNPPTDNYVLSYNDAGANFTWVEMSAGGSDDQTLTEVLGEGADANDLDITSLDKLEGVDTGVFIDLGGDALVDISSDGTVDINVEDEDLSFSDGGANQVDVGSNTGVTDISYGSINLITTGHVDSGTRFIETTTDTDVTVDGSSGIYINNHASTIEYTLPADPETAGGDSKIFIFRNRQANAITITPAAGDVIELDGADETAAEGIVSDGAIGEMATVVGFDDAGTDRWIVFSTNGTWDGATD